MYSEDFSAAVDFLGVQSFVNRDKIGIIGGCEFGGMGLSAAAMDRRIKVITTISMYDMSRVCSYGYNDSMGKAERVKLLESMSVQRWEDFKNGSPKDGERVLPEKLNGDEPQFVVDYFNFYRTRFHPRSLGSNG